MKSQSLSHRTVLPIHEEHTCQYPYASDNVGADLAQKFYETQDRNRLSIGFEDAQFAAHNTAQFHNVIEDSGTV